MNKKELANEVKPYAHSAFQWLGTRAVYWREDLVCIVGSCILCDFCFIVSINPTADSLCGLVVRVVSATDPLRSLISVS
jgi:hypothetical protein